MFFHVVKDVHLTYYNDEIIVLDLQKDRYLILQKEMANVVDFALRYEFQLSEGKYIPIFPPARKPIPDNFYESIETLREMGIIESHNYVSSISLEKKIFSAGAENIDWRMAYGDLHIKVPKLLLLEAYYFRVKVEALLKLRGFAKLVHAIQKAGNRRSLKVINAPEYHMLTTALNRACFYYPIKTKCLEWAATLTLLALKRGWQCNFVIGVQNMPFMAHAWVEANGMVVADSQNLPDDLSVILAEPFGKQKYVQRSY